MNIITYDRPALLAMVVGELRQKTALDYELVVFDDRSEADYTRVKFDIERSGGRFVIMNQHCGKRKFGKLLDVVHADSRRSNADLFVNLPDDFHLCNAFLENAVKMWEQIDAPTKAALNIHRDHRTSCWGSGEPIDCGDYLQTGWMDGAFVCTERYYNFVGRRRWVANRPWDERPHLGSGIYQRICAYLRQQRMLIFGVKRSLVRHMEALSVMNPEARAANSLSTTHFIDDE